ncbi:MAG: hypothetical protein QMD80_07765 [archaeon]|nr:hypothetical protein [archaeon]
MIAIATLLMVEGEILGERTIPAAIFLGIVGIGLITTRERLQKANKS